MTITKGSTISASRGGITATISFEQSDINIHELLDAFRRIAIGLTFHEDSWKDAVIEMAHMYMDEDIPSRGDWGGHRENLQQDGWGFDADTDRYRYDNQ
jgi:hypothetical protein